MDPPVVETWSKTPATELVVRWLVGERTCDTDGLPALEVSPSEVSALGAHTSLRFPRRA
jgi:hypothetical protein